MSNLKEAALEYARMGLHVIPIEARGKKPLIAWTRFQQSAAPVEQVESWWEQWPDANVGLVLGRGVLAVDCDGDGAEWLLAEAGIDLPLGAPSVKTGKGTHVYLSCTDTIANRAKLVTNGACSVDIRGDGGYVLAPPSVHENGNVYEWLEPLRFPLPPIPQALLTLLSAGNVSQPELAPSASTTAAPIVAQGATVPRKPRWIADALRGVGEGSRDDTCVRLAAYFLARGIPAEITTTILVEWGQRCSPVFADWEVRKCVASMVRRHGDPGDAELSQDDRLTVPIEEIAVAMAREHDFPTPAMATPYEELNGFLHGGFRSGELVYLGARPGVGKTVFAVECARHAAKLGVRTLVITREMLMTQLCERMCAQEGMFTTYSMRHERAPDYLDVVARVASLPVYMSDRASTLLDIQAACAECEPAFLVVDYLQLLGGQQREARERIEAISRGLKGLAIQRKIPILCLSSVSRGNDDEAPSMSRLRESGNLEHDADIVIMMHRLKGATACEAIVEKARQGETGVAHLVFDGRFTSLRG